MKKALIYLDQEAPRESIDLLEASDQMFGRGAYSSYGFFVGRRCGEAEGVFDFLVRVDDARIAAHDIINLTNCLEELHIEHGFDAILIPATTFGRMLAPRVAMRLRAGLVAEVTNIRRDDGALQLVRPAFSGRMLASVASRGGPPVMMSVGRNVFSCASGRGKATQTLAHSPRNIESPRVRLLERRERPKTKDIRESEVLVSGGGGVLRHFDKLELLAKELGGMVAASRRVVDSGLAPRQIQVGQSGKTVSPRLYIAIGISGSIQHVVGLKNAQQIIAVNSNRYAPICSIADIVVEGDANEFIERMIERIRQGRTAPPSA
jgi:electron transfer flavoprotein alpha subunit